MERANDESMGERRAFRVSVIPHDPVRLLVTVNDTRVNPIVDELGAGGARLMSVKYYDKFYRGQPLGPATLELEDVGAVTVDAVVKWRRWPRIGIEFVNMSQHDRERLYRYLFKVQRRNIRCARARRNAAGNEVVEFADIGTRG